MDFSFVISKLHTLVTCTENHFRWQWNWVDMMPFANAALSSPVCSCLRAAFVLQEWFYLLKVYVLLNDCFSPVNSPYHLCVKEAKFLFAGVIVRPTVFLLLSFPSSRTQGFMPKKMNSNCSLFKKLKSSYLARWVNLREDGMTCQNNRATYFKKCNINPEAPTIRLSQFITGYLNIQTSKNSEKH